MNGRCENDPLDTAIDVCNKCGGEFCASCLIYPKGRKKHPMCRGCGLALSGVRSNTKPTQLRSRGEIKRAREALRIAAEEATASKPTGFMFFDVDPEFNRGPEIEVATDPELDDEEHFKSSSGLLRRFRRKSEVPEEVAPPPPDIRSVQIGSDGEIEKSPAAAEDLASNTPATELLARLKEQEGGTVQPTSVPLAGEAEPDPNDIWLPPAAPQEPWNLPSVNGPVPQQGAPLSPEVPLAAAHDLSQAPAAATPSSAVPSPAVPSPAAPPAPTPIDMTPPVFVSEKELRAQGPADTDGGGNWVPPTLRGIAPKEVREATELPRRRRTDR